MVMREVPRQIEYACLRRQKAQLPVGNGYVLAVNIDINNSRDTTTSPHIAIASGTESLQTLQKDIWYSSNCSVSRADNMSQESGMFSVRRTREVSSAFPVSMSWLMANSRMTDTRPRQSQCLSNTNACLRHETIDLAIQSPTSTTHYQPCTNNIWLAHVPRARTPIAARLPAFLIRR